MPRRNDLESILIIGSGPDRHRPGLRVRLLGHPGLPRARARRATGSILANSNPATIMTDPDFADATYIEPLDVDVLARIIDKERPDAVLPTLGGQTALNLAMELRRARACSSATASS